MNNNRWDNLGTFFIGVTYFMITPLLATLLALLTEALR